MARIEEASNRNTKHDKHVTSSVILLQSRSPTSLTHATCGQAADPMQVTVPSMRGYECAVVTTLQPHSVSTANCSPFAF
jgi:hypothetical protein